MESVQRLGELISRLGYPNYEIDSDGDITFLRLFDSKSDTEHKVARVWLLRKDFGLKVMVAPRVVPHSFASRAHIAVTISDEAFASWNAQLNPYNLAVERSPAVTVAGGISWDYVATSLDDLIDRTCYAAGLIMDSSSTGHMVNGEA